MIRDEQVRVEADEGPTVYLSSGTEDYVLDWACIHEPRGAQRGFSSMQEP